MKKYLLSVYILIIIFGSLTPVYAKEEVNFDVLLETFQIIKAQYVEEVTDNHTLVYGAIKGMLASLGDQYSRFLEPKSNSEMKVHLDGEFFGIGIQIGMKNNQLTVLAPIEDTPAWKVGLKSKDEIIRIDGNSTSGLSLDEAVSKIRGPRGKKVLIGIRRPTVTPPKEFDFPIIREAIQLKSIRDAAIITNNIGYLRLTTFESKQMMAELQDALSKLFKGKAKGLIIDLRNNGGGLLHNAIMSASLFLDPGKDIVHTVDRNGIMDTKKAVYVKPRVKLPLIVLVNENSASASEIFAGAISDNGRGIVMGSKTFGKASVQNIRELSDNSAVLITIAKYLTPKETDIAHKGIIPDKEVIIPTSNIELVTKSDYIYDQKDDYVLQEAVKLMDQMIK